MTASLCSEEQLCFGNRHPLASLLMINERINYYEMRWLLSNSSRSFVVLLRSVSMKINTKLGGKNVKLMGLRTPAGSAWPPGMGTNPFMILGAVRHPCRPPSDKLLVYKLSMTTSPALLP